MIRHVLLVLSILGAGALVLNGQGTFAGFTDPQTGGVEITAEVVQDGSHDPWFAYEDANNDNRYTEAVDIAIPDEEILDGSYTVSDERHGLVVPKSVGPIDVRGGPVHLAAGRQGHLVVEVRLAGATGVTLLAGGDALLPDLIAETQGDLTIEAGGSLDLQGAYLRAPTGEISLEARDEVKGLRMTAEAGPGLSISSLRAMVQVARSTLTSQGPLTLSAGAGLTAERASLVATGDILIDARGDVHVKETALETPGDIVITAGKPNDTIFVQGARFRDANGVAKAGPRNVNIVGTPAEGTIDETG